MKNVCVITGGGSGMGLAAAKQEVPKLNTTTATNIILFLIFLILKFVSFGITFISSSDILGESVLINKSSNFSSVMIM